jgi:carotenoid cleavage dioxygenase-like enzyme
MLNRRVVRKNLKWEEIYKAYNLGPDRFGSEAIFVPKQPGVSGEEDDGYLIFFVHDENTGYSIP